MSELTTIQLEKLTLHPEAQPREKLLSSVINEYAEHMKEGATFPPIEVFQEGGAYYLADGFHRVHAARKAGLEALMARITLGNLRQAILFSCSSNAFHGARRSDADRERAVDTLLQDKEWKDWSNREIARRAGVSHKFVNKRRKKLEESGDIVATETRKHLKGGKIVEAPAQKPTKPAPKNDMVDLSFGYAVMSLAMHPMDRDFYMKIAVEVADLTMEEDLMARARKLNALANHLEKAAAQLQERAIQDTPRMTA